MKTLLLLRHAKSSWGDASLGDHERPLNHRGELAATRMGRHLRQAGPRPDLVLCSTAVRARATLEGVLQAFEAPPETRLSRELYLASADGLARSIAAVSAEVGVLLVVAHNPGIGELAARLAASGDSDRIASLRRKFPTAALARLRCDAARWEDLAAGCELAEFVRPKDLGP